jgi:hypothetical protein
MDANLTIFILNTSQELCFLCQGQHCCQKHQLRLGTDKTPKAHHHQPEILLIIEDDMALVNNNLVELSHLPLAVQECMEIWVLG